MYHQQKLNMTFEISKKVIYVHKEEQWSQNRSLRHSCQNISPIRWKSENVEICLLSSSQFGFEILLPSTKIIQCKNILRNNLKNSINPDIQDLYGESSKGKNVQVDLLNFTIKFLNQSENAAKKMYKMSFQTKVPLFLSCRKKYSHVRLRFGPLPKPVCQILFNFTVRYLNNTLASRKNMVLWAKTIDVPSARNLKQLFVGIKSFLEEGRYTRR